MKEVKSHRPAEAKRNRHVQGVLFPLQVYALASRKNEAVFETETWANSFISQRIPCSARRDAGNRKGEPWVIFG